MKKGDTIVEAVAPSVATTAVAQHPHFGYAGEADPAKPYFAVFFEYYSAFPSSY
jgi:hypothetical protein